MPTISSILSVALLCVMKSSGQLRALNTFKVSRISFGSVSDV